MINNTIVLTNNHRVPFIARLVNPGDKYGQYGDLSVSAPQVHLYDSRFNHNAHLGFVGQFVSGYLVATLLEDEGRLIDGLLLDTGSPEWTLSSDNVRQLIAWLKEETQQ